MGHQVNNFLNHQVNNFFKPSGEQCF